jgi:hypothetical protein
MGSGALFVDEPFVPLWEFNPNDLARQTHMSRFDSGGSGRTAGLLEQSEIIISADSLADSEGEKIGRFVNLHTWSQHSLIIHELPEDPEVFRVRKLWSLLPTWELRDGDEEIVGYVQGKQIVDRWFQVLFHSRGDASADVAPPETQRFVSQSGKLAATVEVEAPDDLPSREVKVRLRFAAEVQQDPFAKMLLLGAVLIRTLAK